MCVNVVVCRPRLDYSKNGMACSKNEMEFVDKLKDIESYPLWKFQINIVLKSSDYGGVVDGREKLEDLTDDKKKNEWAKKDAKAQRTIVSSLTREPMLHIINCKTAKEMFDKLASIYERDSEQQKYGLLQEFFNLRYVANSDLSSHISKIENLAHRLKALQQEVDEKMIITKILVTLPENYKYFVTAWESMPTSDKTLTNLTARLLAEETRNENTDVEEKNLAFHVVCFNCKTTGHKAKNCKKFVRPSSNNNKLNNLRCFKCNAIGHVANACKFVGLDKTQKSKLHCSICKKNNHLEQDCYFRKNRPCSSTRSNENNSKAVSFLSNVECKYVGINKNKDKEWVVDSGASSHMTNCENLLSSVENIHSEIAVAKKNEVMVSCQKGIVESANCTLKNVLYVPSLSKNLLSVPTITKNGGDVLFTGCKVEITKSGKKILEGYKNENGLYTIKLFDIKNRFTVQQNAQCTEGSLSVPDREMQLWHRRLGHISYSSLHKLMSISEGIKIPNKELVGLEKNFDATCEVCLMAKQMRSPFNSVRTRAKRPLEIIHTDVCGPIDPSTHDNKKYFVTFIDDYTNYTMVYLLRAKYEVFEIIKEYIVEVEAKWNMKTHKLRCDNGGEYTSKNLKDWCKHRGIVLEYTVPYSPQLNGKSERMNRSLLNKTRAILFDSKLNKEMWGEAVRTAAYLINRSPTVSVENTPAENWNGKKPDLSRLKIFGSKVYAKVTKSNLKKLDRRSEVFVFVGYATNGYRLWDESLKKIKIYRDVKVIEDENTLVNVDDECQNRPKPINESYDKEMPEEKPEDGDDSLMEENRSDDNEGGEENVSEHSGEENVAEDSEEENHENINIPVNYVGKRKSKLPEKYKDFVMLSYKEAVSGPERKNWIKAIEEEKCSLIENETWIAVNAEDVKDKKVLSNKWVFTKKENGKFKARLVVRGYEQVEGIDYEETYSPVVSNTSLRIMFALATKKDLKLMQFDVKTAFLYGKLDDEEEIYMSVPEGFENQNKILKLQKTLYGLKQAPFKWNELFTNCLGKYGLKQTHSDRCIFTNGSIYLAIFVDDGILIGPDKTEMKKMLQELTKDFKIKITENPTTFIGMEIKESNQGIKLTQTNYSKQVLERYGMTDCKPTNTPIALPSSKEDHLEEEIKKDYPYREAIGNLLYLSNKTRPDLTLAVGLESRRVENPTNQDIMDVKRTLRYLKGSEEAGISFLSSDKEESLNGYCDADYANDKSTRRSTTGYIIFFGKSPISWCTRRQPIVALSSTEAEFIAAADCVKELLYIKNLLKELLGIDVVVNLNMDNQSAMKLCKNGVFNKRSKHIDVRYHFLSENVKQGKVNIVYVPTNENVADMFTKPLAHVKFSSFKKCVVGNVG